MFVAEKRDPNTCYLAPVPQNIGDTVLLPVRSTFPVAKNECFAQGILASVTQMTFCTVALWFYRKPRPDVVLQGADDPASPTAVALAPVLPGRIYHNLNAIKLLTRRVRQVSTAQASTDIYRRTSRSYISPTHGLHRRTYDSPQTQFLCRTLKAPTAFLTARFLLWG